VRVGDRVRTRFSYSYKAGYRPASPTWFDRPAAESRSLHKDECHQKSPRTSSSLRFTLRDAAVLAHDVLLHKQTVGRKFITVLKSSRSIYYSTPNICHLGASA